MREPSVLKKPITLVSSLALVSALSLGAMATPAYASDVAWNPDAVITVMASDPTYNLDEQYIDGKIVFGSDLGVDAEDLQAYLTNNVTIAGRTIAPDADGYTRAVSDVAVEGDTATFKIGPNTAGVTANYSAEFKLIANDEANEDVYFAMGEEDAETIIGTQLAIAKEGATDALATFAVTERAQARSMNHILITDVINGKEQPVFSGTGTFANGGITIHSHTFQSQTEADYAKALVDAAAAIANSGYTFTDAGNGAFTISNNNGTSENIQVYVYDCNYLNAHELAVGQIWEPEWPNN